MTAQPSPAQPSSAQALLCVHGHFYQPPREDPWAGTVAPQRSAWPHRDWNARVTAECYTPCALSPGGPLSALDRWLNLYEHISFNVGPTLVDWLCAHAPDTWAAIRDADARSLRRLGHGNAVAQAYNHLILPLANARDKKTQVVWGVHHFAHHFGRDPAAMWLPEAAVDLPTLCALADANITLTLLAPTQAARVRPSPDAAWSEVAADGADLDTARLYTLRLPDGRPFTVAFYHPTLSSGVSFGGLLRDGRALSQAIQDLSQAAAGDPNSPNSPSVPRVLCAASDGETYGHHWRSGDEALAFALSNLPPHIQPTNLAAWRALAPPTAEVEIREGTAWSCAHGLGRWTTDCGCRMNPAWHQRWRAPLRDALNHLRDALSAAFERLASPLLHDPWAARDAYITPLLSPQTTPDWLRAHLRPSAASQPQAAARALTLLESQRHAMLMFTSCGWFFDEVSGLETIQCLRYAARACDLLDQAAPDNPPRLEALLLDALKATPSNLHPDALTPYRQLVRPAPTPPPPSAPAVQAAERALDHLYDATLAPLLRDMAAADDHASAVARECGEAILNHRLSSLARQAPIDPDALSALIQTIQGAHLIVHQEPTNHLLTQTLCHFLAEDAHMVRAPGWLLGVLRVVQEAPLSLSLRALQRQVVARLRGEGHGEGVPALEPDPALMEALGLAEGG